MSKETVRLLPSDIEAFEALTHSDRLGLNNDIILMLCTEIRACWSDIELLRPIAIAAAEMATWPSSSETELAHAVAEWQKANREKSG